MNEVSILVLNYNGKNFLEKCFKSIKCQTYKNIVTIVVDNNSTDGSQEYVESLGWVQLISNPKNYGYAKANNIAAQQAKSEFIFILNNDTELFSDTVEKLVSAYQDNSIMAPSQILLINKDTDVVGAAANGMDIFGYPYVDKIRVNTKPFYVDGAGIFLKRDDFIKIGMFDEELFIFEEDIDFSWRAQILGFNLVQCWDSKFYHVSGATVVGGQRSDEKARYVTSYYRRYQNEKNIVRNILKNYSFPLCGIILALLLILHIFEMLALLVMGKTKVVRCYFDAYIWNLKNFKNTMAFRRNVQSARKVSDFVLMSRMYFAYSKLTALIRVGIPVFK